MSQQPTRRERVRQATIDEIKATARQQITADGATSLSMGAIARAMGLTPPALYRYFDNRDALVNELIFDGYVSMGEAMEGAEAGVAAEDYYGRFVAVAHAYRQWALENPGDYGLMFGVHVDAPASAVEKISQLMVRSLRVMVGALSAADDAGCLVIPRQYVDPPSSVRYALLWMRTPLQAEEISLGILALSFTTWLKAHALIWQELYGPQPSYLFSSGELYDMEISVLAENLGLHP